MNRRCFLLAAGWIFAAGVLFSQTMSFPGELGVGDTKLGKYFDAYSLQLSSGDRIVATLSSPDFDAYLLIESPEGWEIENDDYGDSDDARLDILVDTPGEWKVKVTSYEEDEQGEYLLVVNREKLQLLETYGGVLDDSDPISIKDEYYDSYTLRLEARQRIVIAMDSTDFDSFLVLKPPRGRAIRNDDYGDQIDSRIDTITDQAGTYQIYATSNEGGEQGSYAIRILSGGRANIDRRQGSLSGSDSESEDGGYYDEHTLQLEAGDHVIVEMVSDDFDTLLEARGPADYYEVNDDFGGSIAISRLEIFVPETGAYTFTTASYGSGSSGDYSLTIYLFD
jgi:hypothetical protein